MGQFIGWLILTLFLTGLATISGYRTKEAWDKWHNRDAAANRAAVVERPFLNIKPFPYTNTHQYFSIEQIDPEKGDFVLQFQLEIHNIGKCIVKDITFLKCEVRGPRGQIMTPSTPIVSSDLGPDDKYYSRLNLVIATSPSNFKRLPSGKIQLVHDFSMIEFNVVLKYSSEMDPKKEYRIDASYRISADSVEIIRYKTL